MITADIIIKHLLSLKKMASSGIRNTLMCAFPKILDSEIKSQQFQNFFLDPEIDADSNPDAKYNHIKFSNIVRDIYDVLPKYQDESLKVVNLSLNSSNIVKIDINEYIF